MSDKKIKTPPRPCTASDLTWSANGGGQCLNCGATAPATYLVKHAPQPSPLNYDPDRVRELGNRDARRSSKDKSF